MLRLLVILFFTYTLLIPHIQAQDLLYYTQHRPAGLNWQELEYEV